VRDVQKCPSIGAELRMNAGRLGRSHRSLGHVPLVRREGRQDFILLTRRDPEVIERASHALGRIPARRREQVRFRLRNDGRECPR
jgi:hypothetical protein